MLIYVTGPSLLPHPYTPPEHVTNDAVDQPMLFDCTTLYPSFTKLPVLRFDINRRGSRLEFDSRQQCCSVSKPLYLQSSSPPPSSASPLKSLRSASISRLKPRVSTSQTINPPSIGSLLLPTAFPLSTSRRQREPVREIMISSCEVFTFYFSLQKPVLLFAVHWRNQSRSHSRRISLCPSR
jgi:hypothetical protein